MKKLLFLIFPLVLGACSSGPLNHNECDFACVNEGHQLKEVQQNTCLCEMRNKGPKVDKKMPVIPVESNK